MIDLEVATKEELLEYANGELGMSIPEGLAVAGVKKRIKDELKKLGQDVVESEAPAPAAPVVAKPAAKPAPVNPFKVMRTIHIHKSSDDTGADQVFVSVNGKSFLIKRGEDVEVPEPVVEVLKNAVETHGYQDRDGNYHTREVQAYPFMVKS